MPHGDDQPPIIRKTPEQDFFAHHPDPQKGKVEAKKIVKYRYQPIDEKMTGLPDTQRISFVTDTHGG
jgi:hypothetical protein